MLIRDYVITQWETFQAIRFFQYNFKTVLYTAGGYAVCIAIMPLQ